MWRTGGDVENLLPRIAIDMGKADAAGGGSRRRKRPKAWRINPVLAIVFKLSEQSSQIKERRSSEFIIDAGGITEARPVVPEFAKVRAKENRNTVGKISIGGTGEPRRWFDVVDASPVPIIAAAKHHAQTLFPAETLACGRTKLVKAAAPSNGCVATHTDHGDKRLVGGLFGDEVDRSPDRITFLIGGKRFVYLDGIDQVRGDDVQLHVAHGFRGWYRQAVDCRFPTVS